MNSITKHGLDKIDISPLDYWYNYVNPARPKYVKSKQTLFDEALRLSIFNFDKFKFTYVVMPNIDRRSNTGKAEYNSILETASKQLKLVIDADDYNTILEMRKAILNHTTASKLCLDDKLNSKFYFHEKNSNVVIKFKPHFVNPNGVIVNLTSTKDATLENFQKECWNFRHDKKAALYIDGTGIDNMVFITVETSAPYKIGIRYLDDRSVNLGRETYLKNCETYSECLKSGIWYGLDNKIVECSLPEWAFNR